MWLNLPHLVYNGNKKFGKFWKLYIYIYIKVQFWLEKINKGCWQGKIDKKSSPPEIQLKNGTIFDMDQKE
jgi:hypothetical protein